MVQENKGFFVAWTKARGRRVGIYEVEIIKAPASQELSTDQFATRVSEGLLRFTRETQKEACAVLCKNTQGDWSARLVTIHAHTSCAAIQAPEEFACPAGYGPMGADIHSHPTVMEYVPNAVDKLFLNQRYAPRQKARVQPKIISSQDFESKNGYVIHEGGLYHHIGTKDSVRKIVDEQEWGWSVKEWQKKISVDIHHFKFGSWVGGLKSFNGYP